MINTFLKVGNAVDSLVLRLIFTDAFLTTHVNAHKF